MKKKQFLAVLFILIVSIFDVKAQDIVGKVTYYADFFQGRSTSNGEIFDQNKMTCAHLSLPFGTYLRVHNVANGRTVVVKVNDRGPYNPRAVLDISRLAAKKLGMIRAGIVTMEITLLDGPESDEVLPLSMPEFTKNTLASVTRSKKWNDVVKQEQKEQLNNLKSVEWEQFEVYKSSYLTQKLWEVDVEKLVANVETK